MIIQRRKQGSVQNGFQKNAVKFTATSLSKKLKKRKWKPSLPNEFVTSLNH